MDKVQVHSFAATPSGCSLDFILTHFHCKWHFRAREIVHRVDEIGARTMETILYWILFRLTENASS
jgi:hypothetical protein